MIKRTLSAYILAPCMTLQLNLQAILLEALYPVYTIEQTSRRRRTISTCISNAFANIKMPTVLKSILCRGQSIIVAAIWKLLSLWMSVDMSAMIPQTGCSAVRILRLPASATPCSRVFAGLIQDFIWHTIPVTNLSG